MILFTFTKEETFNAVKTESSLFADRQFTDKGDPLYKQLVFDEQYSEVIPLFRELFFEAQTEIINIMPSSLLQDYQCTFIEEDAPDNFMFGLNLSCTSDLDSGTGTIVNSAYFKVITVKVKEALVCYIMYRWLETKKPTEAATYAGRFSQLLDVIRKNVKRTNGIGQVRPFM